MKTTLRSLGFRAAGVACVLAGVLLGLVLPRLWTEVRPVVSRDAAQPSGDPLPSSAMPASLAPASFLPTGFLPTGLLPTANADLEEGDYEFFPNRRSIWIVNRTNGRMANYHFRDDEVGSVDRSRIATINLNSFPRKDTFICLSDRNMNNILWVCNVRTGDVQMWFPARDGSLKAEPPVSTSTELAEKER